MKPNLRTLAHRAFQFGVFLKGIDGILEIGGGTALLVASQPEIRRFVGFLTHKELIENPHDVFANLLVRVSQHTSVATQHFAGIYLLGHGIIKAALAIGLLREVSWSFPAALVFLLAFIFYQLDRIAVTHSITLALLTAIDLAIAGLICYEWRCAKRMKRDVSNGNTTRDIPD